MLAFTIGQAFIKEIIRNVEMVFIMCRPYVWRACMSVRLMRVVLPLNHQRGVQIILRRIAALVR